MEQFVYAVANHADYFLLVLLRISALVFSSPIFGRKNLPNMVKIMLCAVLTGVLYSTWESIPVLQYEGTLDYMLLCVKELLFGLVLGYVTTLFFSLTQTAGLAIDMQMGFGMVNVLDAQSNLSVPMMGNFLYIVLLASFFAVNAHQQLVYILLSTFRNIPVGEVTLNPMLGYSALEVFALSFGLVINIAMPIVAAGLIAEIFMGFVVRTTPQLNIFVVGIPLKIILGFLVLLVILPVYVNFTQDIFREMFNSVDYMIRGLAGAA